MARTESKHVARLLLCLLSLLFVIACPASRSKPPASPMPAPGLPLPDPIRGMTVSCQTGGREWAMPEMAMTLDELKTMGVNTISIHPYARIQNDGHLRFSDRLDQEQITKPLDWARERGLGVMLIPHIAYWGTKFSWRGEIEFTTPEEWDRFFGDYEEWIVTMAKIAQAHSAGILCVGLEYGRTMKYEARWRQIIAAVRAVYGGKLTYGSNWDLWEEVPFYDALDYIGVLAYFPLTRAPNPTLDQLAEGWQQWIAKLRARSRKLDHKPVLFVEVGYNESARAASDPWDYPKGGEHAQEVQLHCIEAALRLADRERPLLAGLFFWKWFPPLPSMEEENFDMREPAIKQLLARYWAGAPAGEAGSGRDAPAGRP